MAKILIIEDEPHVRENMADILSLCEFEVVEAKDGLEGAAAAVSECPDLIVCDIMLPGMDGYSLLGAVRKNPDTRNIPFVFVSALTSRSDLRKGMDLGADDYISKPFEASELVRAVETRLARARVAGEEAETTEKLGPAGLPGGAAFREALHSLLRQDGSGTAVILFVVREFHQVRQALGADAYHKILATLAERMEETCCSGNCLFQLDAGDFALLMSNYASSEEALDQAKRWMTKVREPLEYEGDHIRFSLNAGVSHYPDAMIGPGDLHESAAIALRQSLVLGKNETVLYEENLPKDVVKGFRLAMQMQGALERGEFCLYYQPQFELSNDTLYGMEALVRWQHPELGLISPFNFVSLAEETGFIDKLGEWVLAESCRQAEVWRKETGTDLVLSVNVSPSQLDDPGFAQRALKIIDESGLPPTRVHLELTENRLEYSTGGNLEQLTGAQIQLAIDDFGTGYSSLARLRDLPFTILKIDQAFIRNLHQNPSDKQIVCTIIGLSKDLGMKVVTEGVELEVHKEIIREAGCHLAQGYYYSKPLPADEFPKNIARWRK